MEKDFKPNPTNTGRCTEIYVQKSQRRYSGRQGRVRRALYTTEYKNQYICRTENLTSTKELLPLTQRTGYVFVRSSQTETTQRKLIQTNFLKRDYSWIVQ